MIYQKKSTNSNQNFNNNHTVFIIPNNFSNINRIFKIYLNQCFNIKRKTQIFNKYMIINIFCRNNQLQNNNYNKHLIKDIKIVIYMKCNKVQQLFHLTIKIIQICKIYLKFKKRIPFNKFKNNLMKKIYLKHLKLKKTQNGQIF